MKQIDSAILYFKNIILDKLCDIDCWVAGGAVRDYFSLGRPRSDIDVFFTSESEYNKANVLLCNSEAPVKVLKDTNNAKLIKYNGKLIHLIKKHYYDNPDVCIQSFDFTVCCAAITKEKLYVHETFFIDLANRKLVVNKLPFPLSSLQRIHKYYKKGFWICNGGLLEIAKAIKGVDFESKDQNQLEYYPDGTLKFIRID